MIAAGQTLTHSACCAVPCGAGHGSTGDLQKYNVPHLPFLTPPHLRKGKGGRQPASDPRLVSPPAPPLHTLVHGASLLLLLLKQASCPASSSATTSGPPSRAST